MNSTNERLEPNSLLTIAEVQKRLRVGRTMVYTLMDSGLLRSVRINTARRIYNRDLEDYIDSLVEQADDKS